MTDVRSHESNLRDTSHFIRNIVERGRQGSPFERKLPQRLNYGEQQEEDWRDIGSRVSAHAQTLNEPVQKCMKRLGSFTATLKELQDLPSEWDGQDADSIQPAALLTATRLAMRSATEHLCVPVFVGPLNDGSVQVEWSGPQDRLELEIETDGILNGFYIMNANSSAPRYESHPKLSEDRVLELIHTLLS